MAEVVRIAGALALMAATVGLAGKAMIALAGLSLLKLLVIAGAGCAVVVICGLIERWTEGKEAT